MVFALSSAGVTALELGVPMGDARTAMNWWRGLTYRDPAEPGRRAA